MAPPRTVTPAATPAADARGGRGMMAQPPAYGIDLADRRRGAAPSGGQSGGKSGGAPLDAAARAVLEPSFGHDFGDVRVHTGEAAARSAEAMGVRAFTRGRDIVFARGEYAPATAAGRRLLGHELTHVVQQASAVAVEGETGRPGDTHEREADAVAAPVGYFSFQGETKDDTAHAVGIAKRAAGSKTEYIVVDSMAPGFLRSLGTMADDAAAIKEADAKCGGGWGYHDYAPAVGDGAFDPGLNELHPDRFKYTP